MSMEEYELNYKEEIENWLENEGFEFYCDNHTAFVYGYPLIKNKTGYFGESELYEQFLEDTKEEDNPKLWDIFYSIMKDYWKKLETWYSERYCE